MLTTIKRFIPNEVKVYLKTVGFKYYCPVCKSNLRFLKTFGAVTPHENAQCPICGTQERHRMVWEFFHKRTDLFVGSPKRMLHVAPEKFFVDQLAALPHLDYLTADLLDPAAMVKMDLTDIQYPDDSFDIIYCSHVLEHIPDDRAAMRELFRVLKVGGWAILMVPIEIDKTIEDPTVTDPKKREELFGQDDHVRIYGPDFVDRLESVGFNVEVFESKDFLTAKQIKKLSLYEKDYIFYCTKSY